MLSKDFRNHSNRFFSGLLAAASFLLLSSPSPSFAFDVQVSESPVNGVQLMLDTIHGADGEEFTGTGKKYPESPTIPSCLDDQGKALPVDDLTVLGWKTSTPNQTLKRAHVQGTVGELYADHSGHRHFEIKIGPQAEDTLEVVYNLSFGALPPLKAGDQVEACGDYITSNAPTSQYPASPDNAIMHWVHRASGNEKHKGGFVVINGKVYGD